MNVRQNVKTSLSIPEYLEEELYRQAIRCGISRESLAKRVLLKFIRHLHRARITADTVITYNKRGSNCKKIYFRWDAKEYTILLQLRAKTRFSVSYILTMSLEKYLNRIVMAILRKKKKNLHLKKELFRKQLVRLRRFFIYWPNLDTDILPFFQIHIDFEIY